jgi:hypothetical protein
MAFQSENQPNRHSFFGRRRRPPARGSHFHPSPAPADTKSTSSLHHALTAFLGKLLIIPLGVLLSLLCVGLFLFSGYVLGKISPEYMVTVQPFEILPESGSPGSLSGKGASDMVVDILNDVANHAAQFHGTDYYRYTVMDGAVQPVSLHQVIKVPAQTSYGIELKGISVDSVLHLYDQARYDQWIVSGDVVPSPQGLIARIRLNNSHVARSWETPPSAHATPSEIVRQATYLMLANEVPELLGQSYLQQANYDDAEKVFRQWAIDDSQNWKPSYYLSLVYSYRDKPLEASSLAKWSSDLQSRKSDRISRHRVASAGSEGETIYRLAQTTKIALQTSATSDAQELDRLQQTLNSLGPRQSRLGRIFKPAPANVDYRIQRALILDKEARIALGQDSQKAYELASQAVDILGGVLQRVPENSGLHEQHAIALKQLVKIMRKQGKDARDIRAKESEEAKEFTTALELRPSEESPLWGAVYAQIHLGNNEDAVDLARTITLLQPDSKAARTAYIVALAHATRNSEGEPEREKELEDRIKRLLELNPDESQLSAIWHALLKNNNDEGLELVAAGARRLFPRSSAFEEPRLRLHSADMAHYDSRFCGTPLARFDHPRTENTSLSSPN